jgi:hypothetical protein
MHPFPTTCPVCQGTLHIESLRCDDCETSLHGQFSLGWIGRLSREQLDFVELLVKNRGNINSVASELRIAYNTARSRLDEIVTAIGGSVEDPARVDRRIILDRLAAKEISVEEAMQLLKG